MAEQTSSRTKRRRVQIHFLPGPRAGRPPDEQDPLADAANPMPGWLLELSEGGQSIGTWELWHPADLASSDTLKLMSIEREIDALPGDEYVARVREQIQLLIPDLPPESFECLTHRQLQAIGTKCWERPGETRKESAERKADAANPPDGERASASSSRSPVASMAGATPS
jgi:hypothetical protein